MKPRKDAKIAAPDSDKTAELLAHARSGDAHAQFLMGEAFRIGDALPLNYAHALHWFLQAAEQGHADAQNNAGSMLLNGMGTESNPEEAAHWYRKAAEQDQADAQFNLALRYLHGNGAELDPAEAAAWLFKAVEHGRIEAIGQLGTLFRFGQGVDQNFVAAAEMHVIAAMDGDVTSRGNLQDYQDEIEKAAIAGSVIAALCLAKMYDRGIVVPKSKAHVYAWLQWAQQHGTVDNDSDALSELDQWANFESMTLSESAMQQTETLLAQMQETAKGDK